MKPRAYYHDLRHGDGLRPKSRHATLPMQRIQQLYKIERESKHLSAQARQEKRQAKSIPLLTAFRQWLDQHLPEIPPKSALGKAMNYAEKTMAETLRPP